MYFLERGSSLKTFVSYPPAVINLNKESRDKGSWESYGSSFQFENGDLITKENPGATAGATAKNRASRI